MISRRNKKDDSGTFQNFFAELAQESLVVNVFKREHEGFSFHGKHARSVALLLNNSIDDIRCQYDMDALYITRDSLRTVIPKLLSLNLSVALWARGGLTWKAVATASPANFKELLTHITDDNTFPTDGCQVASIALQNGIAGFAVVDTFHKRLGVAEFLDESDHSRLLYLLQREQVRECILTDIVQHSSNKKRTRNSEVDRYRKILVLLGKLNICTTRICIEAVENNVIIGNIRELLVFKSDLDVAQLGNMLSGVRAVGSLLSFLRLSESHYRGQFDLRLIDLCSMKYDHAVVSALGLRSEQSRAIYSRTDGEPISSDEGDKLRHKNASVFDVVDRTKTRMGTRLLKSWMLQPTREKGVIQSRLDCVEAFVLHPHLIREIRTSSQLLENFPGDMTALAHKVREDSSQVKLFHMFQIYKCLLRLQNISDMLCQVKSSQCQQLALRISGKLHHLSEYVRMLEFIVDDEALARKLNARSKEQDDAEFNAQSTSEKAGLNNDTNQQSVLSNETVWRYRSLQVRPGVSPALQNTHDAVTVIRAKIEYEVQRVSEVIMASTEVVETKGKCLASPAKSKRSPSRSSRPSPAKLHLERNATQGLHLRVTKRDSANVLKTLSATTTDVSLRSTVLSVQKSGTLFLTSKLSHLIMEYESLMSLYKAADDDIVSKMAKIAIDFVESMLEAADLVAEVDTIVTLAHVATTLNWCKPTIAEEGSQLLRFEGLRFPCLDLVMGEAYVPCNLDMTPEKRVVLITGPNMGGKSTCLLAVCCAVMLAHTGSFVPATSAVVSITDRLMLRVGASDNISEELSTFMVEMLDVAAILREATPSSLVLIDELGRGTSTHEGFGIASATIRQLALKNESTVLFATHFHELTTLESEVHGVFNMHVGAETRVDDCGKHLIKMKYDLQPGPCPSSYGLRVAQLCEFPEEIITNARTFSSVKY